MSQIKFLKFNEINHDDLMAIVNEDSLRTHLIEHPYFDEARLQSWIAEKIDIDAMDGCRVRAVYIDEELAGWCGIQPDSHGFELAIVLSKKFWGSGRAIFNTLICWAKELEHQEVLFHLLDSRREYRSLNQLATKVYKTELSGRCFTTYHLQVGA
ncbi:GNAT family N-acetyltransferase [Motiliproteus sediminis]|uniref:GNAT family N-acetyltransferase n=1 Tax=Motiliproteus sediminis TaxID=1468178 RepID=UPI001AEFDDF4|nr:GNAT family N-acetyltransferase [Motiliproteus sediminis]